MKRIVLILMGICLTVNGFCADTTTIARPIDKHEGLRSLKDDKTTASNTKVFISDAVAVVHDLQMRDRFCSLPGEATPIDWTASDRGATGTLKISVKIGPIGENESAIPISQITSYLRNLKDIEVKSFHEPADIALLVSVWVYDSRTFISLEALDLRYWFGGHNGVFYWDSAYAGSANVENASKEMAAGFYQELEPYRQFRMGLRVQKDNQQQLENDPFENEFAPVTTGTK